MEQNKTKPVLKKSPVVKTEKGDIVGLPLFLV